MSKSLSVRLDDIHAVFLEEMVAQLERQGVKTTKTDVIQKALYAFANDSVLGSDRVKHIIDAYYRGPLT